MSLVKVEIDESVLRLAQEFADRQSLPLEKLIEDALIQFMQDEDLDKEPSEEEIVLLVEDAIRDFEAGKLVSARDFLAELETEMSNNADND